MYELRFYVSGKTPRSLQAIETLSGILETGVREGYTLDVIDLREEPGMAEADKVFATPTAVKLRPDPARRIVGDLSDKEKVLTGLALN
jgi:circadian clock protein KaiB